jgi:hypothetical protein
MTLDLDRDEWWRRLHSHDWICPNCGVRHAGVFDLACEKPHYWEGSAEKRPNTDVWKTDTVLTQDFCVFEGRDYFVRCVLPLPIIGQPDTSFCFGIWSTLAKENFELYVKTFDGARQRHLGPWFGWFANRLDGYPDTLNLKCRVHLRDGQQRPEVELPPSGHPLAIEQREGITLDRLLDLYAANGHDIRDALTRRS